jgi:hypothetical protein
LCFCKTAFTSEHTNPISVNQAIYNNLNGFAVKLEIAPSQIRARAR